MGASGWSYVIPFRGDVSESLRELREQVFRDKDYYWWDDFEEAEPRPATIEGIWASEEMKQSGTHSILDVSRVVETTRAPSWDNWREDLGTVRPLAAARVVRYFGTDRPTRAQFEALSGDYEAPGHREFVDEPAMRGTGRYMLLYEGDTATEVAFWGFSGD
jgi:hypothetical protein